MANLLPEECRPHCDVLFEGEAEYTWPRFLARVRRRPARRPLPRAREDPPARLAAAAAGRAAAAATPTASSSARAAARSPASSATSSSCTAARCASSRSSRCIAGGRGLAAHAACAQVFFADDNFVGNRAYAKELLRALVDVERAAAARRCRSTPRPASTWSATRSCSACCATPTSSRVFIGIESPRKASLAETHKTQNEKLDLVEAVHKIQSYNLFVSAGMIVGFDNDDAEHLRRAVRVPAGGADPDRHAQRPAGGAEDAAVRAARGRGPAARPATDRTTGRTTSARPAGRTSTRCT